MRRSMLCSMFGQGKSSMFKVPGRKSLDDICKLTLLESTDKAQVASIWNMHHSQFVQYWGRTISTEAYNALQPRLAASPYFICPVFRDKGLFNTVTNFNKDLVGVVPLGEYQKKGDSAEVHMTIQFFTELSRSKGLVLVRCEIQDKVFKRSDCIFITQMLLKYYTVPRLYEAYVESLNKRPNQFDFHGYLRAIKDDAGKDEIQILDKKTDLRRDAYGPVIDMPSDFMKEQILAGTAAMPAQTPPPQ